MADVNGRYSARYGVWGGNPKGDAADFSRCCEIVSAGPGRIKQCGRKRGCGPDLAYCKQHAKRFDECKAPNDEHKPPAVTSKSIVLTEKEATLIHEVVGSAMTSDDEGHMARDGYSLMVKLNKAFGFEIPVTPNDFDS